MKMEKITNDTKEIERITWSYFKKLYFIILENLKYVYNFSDRYPIWNLNQDQIKM